ncbi:mediator complex subunit Srb9 [Schizosaccharomyces japonicus yFS275]|uniref:Mediator of RNA polymerase II transcription subunit 13 n=1 Tax=Schizosaccharomyces japonicus (strain yFS275 / FY16936) TaxID=402676 RepID=B6JYV7_SCHJY|nr:mediator complex subunit Srb9 [Schizosaccharomyces japonicus yFS275]EEB06725.1 mediator complex subunit Srb9 [Schizosaccharomyces japonicus yFS275]
MVKDGIALLNYDVIEFPEVVFYKVYVIESPGNDIDLERLLEFESRLKGNKVLNYINDENVYTFFLRQEDQKHYEASIYTPIAGIHETNNGFLKTSHFFFTEKIIDDDADAQLFNHFIFAIHKFLIFEACRSYGFISISDYLIPLRLRHHSENQLWTINGYPLICPSTSVIPNGTFYTFFRSSKYRVYKIGSLNAWKESEQKEVILAPFGIRAFLQSPFAKPNPFVASLIAKCSGLVISPSVRWVRLRSTQSMNEYSWPLDLCFALKSMIAESDSPIDTTGDGDPFLESLEMSHEIQRQINLGKVPDTPSETVPLNVPSNSHVTFKESLENKTEVADTQNFFDLVTEPDITDADFDYFDTPTNADTVTPIAYWQDIIENEDMNHRSTQSKFNVPSGPTGTTRTEHYSGDYGSEKSTSVTSSFPLRETSPGKFSFMSSNYRGEALSPKMKTLNAKYAAGGKYWCPYNEVSSESVIHLDPSVSEQFAEPTFTVPSDSEEEVSCTSCELDMDKTDLESCPTNPDIELKTTERDSYAFLFQAIFTAQQAFSRQLIDQEMEDQKFNINSEIIEQLVTQDLWFSMLPFWKVNQSLPHSESDIANLPYIQTAASRSLHALFRQEKIRYETPCLIRGNELCSRDPGVSHYSYFKRDHLRVMVRLQNEPLSLKDSALKKWTQLLLEPMSGQKEVSVLSINFSNYSEKISYEQFIQDLKFMYELMNFGKMNELKLSKYPDGQVIVDSGLLSEEELESFKSVNIRSFWTQLGSCIATEHPTKNVMILIFFEGEKQGLRLLNVCGAFNILKEEYIRVKKQQKLSGEGDVSFQSFPFSMFQQNNLFMGITSTFFTDFLFNIYDRCFIKTCTQQFRQPAYLLLKPISDEPEFQMLPVHVPSVYLSNQELHVTYATVFQRWVVFVWCDSYGEILDVRTYVKELESLDNVLKKAWNDTLKLITPFQTSWSINVMKIDALGMCEINCWRCIQKKHTELHMSLGYFLIPNSRRADSDTLFRIQALKFEESEAIPDNSFACFYKGPLKQINPLLRDTGYLIITRGIFCLCERRNFIPILEVNLAFSAFPSMDAMHKLFNQYSHMCSRLPRLFVTQSHLPFHVSTTLYYKQLIEMVVSELKETETKSASGFG